MPVFTWRRLTTADFPLLSQWLARPHVHRWWNHDSSPAGVERDFGPTVRGEEPGEDLLVLLGGQPLGLVQRSRFADFPEYADELAPLLDVPPEAFSLDYFVADEQQTGRGLGTRMLSTVIADSWTAMPTAGPLIIPVVATNVASWRMLERAGLTRVAEGGLEPDNPVDPPLHFVYRMNRPRSPDHQTQVMSGSAT